MRLNDLNEIAAPLMAGMLVALGVNLVDEMFWVAAFCALVGLAYFFLLFAEWGVF
jgi:hypothetical protein